MIQKNKLRYKFEHLKLKWKLVKQALFGRDFDYEYLILLIQAKLDCMAHYFRNVQWIDRADTYANEMETASKLIDICLKKDAENYDENWNCKRYTNMKNAKRYLSDNFELKWVTEYPEDLRSEKAKRILVDNIERLFKWYD